MLPRLIEVGKRGVFLGSWHTREYTVELLTAVPGPMVWYIAVMLVLLRDVASTWQRLLTDG